MGTSARAWKNKGEDVKKTVRTWRHEGKDVRREGEGLGGVRVSA